jgi:hypothetical protein
MVGQETPVTGNPVPAGTTLQLEVPPAGLAEVRIWPALAVTHSEGAGQETAFR